MRGKVQAMATKPLTKLVVVIAALTCAGAALPAAALAGPVWDVAGHHGPTSFQPGETGEYTFHVSNVGDAAAPGPNTLEIELPPGVTTRVRQTPELPYPGSETTWVGGNSTFEGTWDCTNTLVAGASSLRCSPQAFLDPLPAGTPHLGRLTVYVDIAPWVTGDLSARARMSGGGGETVEITETAPVGPAPTTFGIAPGTFEAEAYDRQGRPERRAGAHPFRATVGFDFNRRNARENVAFSLTDFHQVANPIGTPRDLEVTLPRGFVGNPQAVAQCKPYELVARTCPIDSQVGTVEFAFASLQGPGAINAAVVAPVYNMLPPEGVVANFAFQADARPVNIMAELDPSDYSIKTVIRNVNETLPVHYQRLTLWGVPADRAHDSERWYPPGRSWGATFGLAPKPFLTLPSECDVPGVTRMTTTSWQGAADPPAAAAAAGARLETAPQRLHSCEKQQFRAALNAQPETNQVDAPTGLNVQLDVDQNENPNSLGTPPLNKAVVQLPDGMSVSPSAATGLGGCALAQIGLGTNDEPTCPDPSKIGKVSIRTPLLPDPLTGSVYLARQNDNPFRSLLAIYLVVRGPGVIVKLPGKVDPNPSTGQLTATFDNNPQVPFNTLDLQFNGGSRGSLATPTTCGEKTTTSSLTPWNAVLPTVVTTSTFNASYDGAGSACPATQPFDPSLEAGMVSPVAGQDSAFTLTFGRADRNQYLSGVSVKMPQGLLGNIASATLCTDKQATAGACPESSRVGSATVAAGPGATPFWLSGGRVYVTESYRGGPYGLAIMIRALAGPFDLGEVIVRAAIYVDPVTTQLSVVSDPMPTILEGIPLRMRTVNVAIDRPGFMFNPTSCTPKSIGAQIVSTLGAVADRSSRFQVGACAALPFRPRMTLEIGRRGHTGREATTPLNVTLEMTKGQANLKVVKVSLPTTVNARLRVVNQACTLAAFNAGACGARARIGAATAISPVLRKPLRGTVYFVRSGIRRLPDLMVRLEGEVSITLSGKVTIPGGRRLATEFDTIPDAPISSFKLSLVDGRQGPVGAVSNLCIPRNRKPPADIEYRSQSGRLIRLQQRLVIKGCARGRAVSRGRSGRSRRAARRGGRSRRAAARARRS